MKLWLLTILLIFTAATGSAQCLSGVCAISASPVILREKPTANTVSSVPYSCLQDMIQPESASLANCSWKRQLQDLPAWGLFRPELLAPSAAGSRLPCERSSLVETDAILAFSSPPRAGPSISV